MATVTVFKHWVVAPYNPGASLDQATVGGLAGSAIAGGVTNNLFGDSASAMDAARTMASNNPGSVFVVYEAQWYAYTDLTPVNLLPVMLAAV